jgi:hypothetical protein
MSKTIKLLAIDGRLWFPTGDWIDHNRPSLLIAQYPSGDCDTVSWPLESGDTHILAIALYDERETNIDYNYETAILLPDGTVFNVDYELTKKRGEAE